MPFYEYDDVKIHYEEVGSGVPLMVLPGGGLNAAIPSLTGSKPYSPQAPFNPMEEFKDDYRCIAMDLRNANHGESTGPVDIDKHWDAFAEDQLGLMDHLGIDKFMVLGFCIGGPLIWNLLRLAPDRVIAAVISQPSGYNPDHPKVFFENNMKHWGAQIRERRPELSEEHIKAFLSAIYLERGDFVFTASRDDVRNCQTPVLVMPDDIPAHPLVTAMESAELAPNAQISLFPWKEPKSRVPIAVRHVRSFLKAYAPAA